MYRFILVLLLSVSVIMPQGNNLERYLANITSDSLLNQAQYGWYAVYTDDSAELLNVNGYFSLAPASGLKLFTTAAALNYLGEDFRFETALYHDGKVEDEILQGNLYIRGGGDPTLGSDMVKGTLPADSLMQKWVTAIREKGIRSVEGDILADDLLFDEHSVPDYWPWIDMGNYYAAGTSALCFYDNLYHLYFKPGKNVGNPARVLRTEPLVPGLEFINHMKTGRAGSGDNGYIYAAPGQYEALLRGTIPIDCIEFSIKGALPDPPLLCAQTLRNALETGGIKVRGNAGKNRSAGRYTESGHITTTVSLPLRDMVFMVNKKSINLYTEQLLCQIALKERGTASTREGIKTLMTFLKSANVPVNGIKLYDGSGLSRTNTITAVSMVKLLQFCAGQPWYDSFYRSLAITGDPEDIGSFKRFGKNSLLEGNARVKSGLITGVRSLSGYLTAGSGKTIAFSLIINNYNGSVGRVDTVLEQILIRLAGQY